MTLTSIGGRVIARVLDGAALIASLVVVGLMLFLVVARYVFGWSIIGLLEVIMAFGMWVYMLGALIASRRREHLVIDFFAQKIASERARAAHKLVVGGITLAAALFFTLLSWKMLAWGFSHPQTTPGLGIPLWIPQSAIIVAAFGSSLYALRDMIMAARAIWSPPVNHNTEEERTWKA
ncbi:TRAP transporter small permease [Nitrogeniibacter aestuarii]|uniref:TRAP transporter small permease n=1 Tax=Nitrogeniibacter aestuarii TaxID=2815343 RepID=UPI001D110436|nr:TRAP transporter small permease subunit [Nitrogeniibacter aestuarii]